MRIAILGPNDTSLGFMDNGVASALHFYDDTLHLYLAGNAYTYTFKCLTTKESLELLQVGNKLSFTYNGNGYYLNIITVDYDEYEMDISCTGLSFELLNEQVDKYEAAEAMTLVQYLEATGTEVSHFPVVVNEVSDKSIKTKWDGRDTLLKRIFSLCNVFGCEVSFDARLNKDYSLAQVEMSFKRQLGSDRTGEILRYGKDITSISKKSDITDLYTAIRPIGKDGLTLQGYTHDKESDGCYVNGVNILNPDARDRFPSFVVGNDDAYIARYWDYDTDSQAELYGHALAELRKNSVPKVSYEVDGYVDASIGDRFTIEDAEYTPTLYVEARVVEQEICFTDPTKCKTTFDNFTEVKAELSSNILDDVQKLIDANKTYQISVSSTAGTLLPPEVESTILEARVKDGSSDVTDSFTIKWYRDGLEATTGTSIAVTRESLDPSSVFRVGALDAAGETRAEAEVTITKVVDGETVSVVETVVEYQVSNSGTEYPTGEWSPTVPETQPGEFLWVRTTIKYSDGQTSVTYSVSRNGEDGTPGSNGEDPVILKVTSSNGEVFKNASIVTVLTATVYKGNDKLTGAALSELGPIQWYKDDNILDTIGNTLNIKAGDAGSRAVYSARIGAIARDDITLISVVDVQGIFRYWQLSAEKPAKPTTFPPSSPWVDAEPEFSSENQGSLWYVDCTHFSDDTWTCSEVQMSSDYEATKALYADALQQLADAETRIDVKMGETEESIRNEVSEKYYSKDDTDKLLGEVSTTVEQTKDSIDMRFSSIQVDVDNLSSDTNDKFQQYEKYIRFVDGNIVLGEEGNSIVLTIENDRISFSQSGQEVAYLSQNQLHITDAEVTHSLALGNFAFIPRANGSLDFKKVK